MDENNNFNDNENQNNYSFPLFGTGKANHESNANNNQNVDLNTNNNVNNQTLNNTNNQNSNQIPGSNANSNNSIEPPRNSNNAQNNGLQSGNKDNNKENGPDLHKNNNGVNNPNNTTDDKKDSSDNKNGNNSKNDKNSKNGKDNSQSGDKSGKKHGISGKNIAKRGLGMLGHGAKKLGNNLAGDEGYDDESGGNEAVSMIANGAGALKNFVLLIIRHPWIAIILAVIILGLFLIFMITATTNSIFGGYKYGGWYCENYSPTKSNNPGDITSFYGWRMLNGLPDNHKGIDISYGKKGAEIIATKDGSFYDGYYYEKWDNDYGMTVEMDDSKEVDDKKYRVYYAHMCSLKEEDELNNECQNGTYSKADGNCVAVNQSEEEKDEDGNIIYKSGVSYKYLWPCGGSRQALENLYNKYKTGSSVKQGDVIGYVSDTGARSKDGDFHLHYEVRADKLYDTPDQGYVAEDLNRYFNIESISIGCDPVRSVDTNAPTVGQIIKWQCEKPIKTEDEIFEYCNSDDFNITPEEYRFKGGYKGRVNDEVDDSIVDEIVMLKNGEKSNRKLVCKDGREYNVTTSTTGQCAGVLSGYFKSILTGNDYSKFERIRTKYRAVDWVENNSNAKKSGGSYYETGSEPKVGALWVSNLSDSTCGDMPCGHVMAVEKVEGNNVTLYECNYDGHESCRTVVRTKETLSKNGFQEYIYILGDDC